MKKMLGLSVLLLACSANSESENIGQTQDKLITWSNHHVFESGTGLPDSNQWGTDPFVQLTSNGDIYVAATGKLIDPLYSEGASLWRSTDNGGTWNFLGTAGFIDHLGAEPAMHVDSYDRLWIGEFHLGPDFTPIYRYDNPASIVNRATDWNQKSLGTPIGERGWMSSYGNRIHFQCGEALVEPVVRVSFNGSANPPVFTTSIPVATNPLLRAEVATGTSGGTEIVGIAMGPLAINQSTGFMCAPLLAINGSTNDYMPAHSLWTACSSDGLNWTNTLVYKNLAVNMMNFWPASAIDSAGNFYFVISANMDSAGGVVSGLNIFLFSSSNGVTWSGPKKVNSGSGTNMFARAVGGCNGGVDVVWYGTSTNGNPSTLPSTAEWRVHMAQSKNATAASPAWTQTDVAGSVVHYGVMNHKGSFGDAGVDYRVVTIPALTLDSSGGAHVVWQDTSSPWSLNPNANPATQSMGNPSFGPLYHGRQTNGPKLDTCP